MGTTLTAMQAGSTRVIFIARIAGYNYLLTSGSASTVGALGIGDWGTNVIGGLVVEIDNEQVLNPWEPFNGAGKATLRVPAALNDRFGIDTHRSNAGTETTLKTTIDRDDTSIKVKRSDDFTSGTAYIGTECITWITKPDTNTITATTRGKYSEVFGTTKMAEHHRCVTSSNGVRLEPVVSEQPRQWIGRKVGIWAHRVVGSTIDSAAQAQLVFAGYITEIRDNPSTFTTDVLVEHELDRIKRQVIGSEFWEATCENGHAIVAGQQLVFKEYDGTTWRTANNLTVVASGASGTSQVNEGRYSLEELCSIINQWLGGEYTAGRLNGTYTLSSPEDVNGNRRSVLHYNIAGSGTVTWAMYFWTSSTSAPWNTYLGVSDPQIWDDSGTASEAHGTPSDGEPLESSPFSEIIATHFTFCDVTDERGTFVDQYQTLPASMKTFLPAGGGGVPWGLFLFDNRILFLATPQDGQLVSIIPCDSPIVPRLPGSMDLAGIRVKAGDPPPKIRQVFAHEGAFGTILKWLFYSTGTAGYNHSTYDVLGVGQGLAVPADLLGSTFENSCDLVPGANISELIVIDKPMKLEDILKADLIFRRSHLVWKSGKLQFVCWSTPSALTPMTSLGESTKAEPAGNNGDHRTATTLDSTWLRNLVKINYNRDITQGIGKRGVYRNSIDLEDSVSVDDQGGNTAAITLDLCNVYSDNTDTGPGIKALLAEFLAWMPYFSRPIRKITRSIDQRYYEGYAPGDQFSVTDLYARDPSTGARGVSGRPGLVVKHRCNFGGPNAGDPTSVTPQQGEVEIAFLEVARQAQYSPCAEVDDTASTGGFTAGYNNATSTLRCYANKHSESSETADAGNFAIGDKILIVEKDPTDAGNPTYWARTVSSVSGNDIVLTAALSSPAFDTSKKYRIISAVYTTAQATQKLDVYQAHTDGMVLATTAAYHYGEQQDSTIATQLDHTEIPELIPTLSYGPNTGAPRDTGHEEALIVLLENLQDHGTARQSPSFLTSAVTNTTYATGWKTLYIRPIFLGASVVGNHINRRIAVAPFFRSADGSTVSIRVSLSGRMPNASTLNDMEIKAPAQSNTWSTASTTWTTGAEQYFFLGNYNGCQYAFLIVEATYQGSFLGIAEYVVRERFIV